MCIDTDPDREKDIVIGILSTSTLTARTRTSILTSRKPTAPVPEPESNRIPRSTQFKDEKTTSGCAWGCPPVIDSLMGSSVRPGIKVFESRVPKASHPWEHQTEQSRPNGDNVHEKTREDGSSSPNQKSKVGLHFVDLRVSYSTSKTITYSEGVMSMLGIRC